MADIKKVGETVTQQVTTTAKAKPTKVSMFSEGLSFATANSGTPTKGAKNAGGTTITSDRLPGFEYDGDDLVAAARDGARAIKRSASKEGDASEAAGGQTGLDFRAECFLPPSQDSDDYLQALENLGGVAVGDEQATQSRENMRKFVQMYEAKLERLNKLLGDEQALEEKEKLAEQMVSEVRDLLGGRKVEGLQLDPSSEPGSDRLALLATLSFLIGGEKGLSALEKDPKNIDISMLQNKLLKIEEVMNLSASVTGNAAKPMAAFRPGMPGGAGAGRSSPISE